MKQNNKESFFMSLEAADFVSEISCQVARCRTMVEYLYNELGTVYDWEKRAPGRKELKDALFDFADIALDYVFDAFTKLEQIEEATQIIDAPVTDESTQGAKQNIHLQDTMESGKSQLGGR